MFERFTKPARQVVTDAVDEAERERAPRVAPKHVLLALLGKETRSAAVLAGAGVTREALLEAFEVIARRGGLTDAEAEALRSLGIDVDTVVEQVEREHGAGALTEPRTPRLARVPFADETKELLVTTLRQAVERGDRRIGDEHLLLALAFSGGAAQVLAAHGLTYPELRARLAQAA
ncbi:MAG TPA: Clp protease N-terminal domain-containing protein [Actinophytocola sp.]|jgi:ATP-dependent Clp protease ATP-binding subunit ClpA|nr:Clp protease N-terminal domain-containing protein [Actinophytocola sp.]